MLYLQGVVILLRLLYMETNQELKTNEYLKGIVSNLPEGPGIYQYLNAEGTIIYVGKAKNLKRRVYSYFSKDHEPGKTRVLVSKIADIRYIVVNSEEDALLLKHTRLFVYKMNIFHEYSKHARSFVTVLRIMDHTVMHHP